VLFDCLLKMTSILRKTVKRMILFDYRLLLSGDIIQYSLG
jgi:hypothetical protein